MPRFSDMIIAYLVIGAVMFGGGAISWDQSGVAQFFVSQDDDGGLSASDNTDENLTGISGALNSVVDMVAGPILVIWDLVVGLIAYLNWPIIVLLSNNAPPMLVLLLGVPFNAGFYLSVLRLLRVSA